ncbi:MAG: sigma-70 family RNA polymerase sigma factor [Chloroflexi bacterium]|nr:sigma-70 family RNA polymerase sigma factor [Chloroflexota bacterium]
MPEPGAELLARAILGEEDAIVALVQSQQAYIYSICLQIARNREDAADFTQEAVIRMLRALPSFRAEDGARFTTWLYRLAANVALDGLRRKRARPSTSLDAGWESADEGPVVANQVADPDRAADPADAAATRDEAARVRAAVELLPLAQRTALTLFYFQEKKYEEIASTMDLPLNTVKSHIRRAKERLAVLLQEHRVEWDGAEGQSWVATR